MVDSSSTPVKADLVKPQPDPGESSRVSVNIHLLDIEKPRYMNTRVRIPLIVAGQGKAFSIPSKVEVWCAGKEDGEPCIEKKLVTLDNPAFCLQCIGKDERKIREAVLEEAKRPTKCNHIKVGNTQQVCTVRQMAVYPDCEVLDCDTSTGKVVDDLGREWKRIDAVYLGDIEANTLPYIAEGTVVAHPQTQEITVVIDRLDPKDAEDDHLEPIQFSYGDLEALLGTLARYTAVKGRREAHLWALLLYATPTHFRFDGELVEGWGKGLFFGDTTTGKGQIAKAIRKLAWGRDL